MIEAANKMLKYRFLYNMDIDTVDQLKKVLPNVINTYNNMVHSSHKYFTPNEILNNFDIKKELIKIKYHIKQAKIN